MKKSTVWQLLSFSVGLVLLASVARASETPETILIRRTLANELSGYRRADSELVLSAYHQDFFALQGNGNADPRAWSPLYKDLSDFTRDLEPQLAANRYDTERTLLAIQVRGHQATVASIDSGRIVDRGTEDAQIATVRRFWTLRKSENEWLITSRIDNLGDSALAVQPETQRVAELADLLQREKQGWENGTPSAIANLFDDHFIGYSGNGNLKPESWKLLFSGAEELTNWLNRRLRHTTYRLDREVIFTTVDAERREGLALTWEQVTTEHHRGDAVHRTERYVLWGLSRRSGDWKITSMCYNIGLPVVAER